MGSCSTAGQDADTLARVTSPRTGKCATIAIVGVAIGLIALAVFGDAWLLASTDWTRAREFVVVTGYFLLAWVLPRTWAPAVVAAVLATGLTAWSLTTVAQPLGDHVTNLAMAQAGRAWMANPLSAAVNHWIFRGFGLEGLDYVAPLAGGIGWWALLLLALRCFSTEAVPSPRLPRMIPLIGATPLIFFRGFVELTQLAVPFAVFALLALRTYDQAKGRSTRTLGFAAAWLGLAVSLHGAFLSFVPPILVVVAWHHWRDWRRLGGQVAATACVMGAVIGSTLLLLMALDIDLASGHLSGGGDRSLMVPVDGAGFRYPLGSGAHLEEIANILLVMVPPLLLAPLMMLGAASRSALVAWLGTNRWLLAACLGTLGFVGLLGFDLGHPDDLDLMLCTGAPLLILGIGIVAAGLRGPPALRATVLVAMAACVVQASAFRQKVIVRPWDPESHPLGAAGIGEYRDDGQARPLLRVMGESMQADLRGRMHALVSLSSPQDPSRQFRCAVIVALGVGDEPLTAVTTDGLVTAFPLPGDAPHSHLVMSSLQASLGPGWLPPRRGPFKGPVRVPSQFDHAVLQGIVETAAGLVTTNAVSLRLR